jgi:dTDP-4-amino-4,6-dideoxygalactose transaminase
MPYLSRIDANRTYSNHGALARELESRLSHAFGFSSQVLITAANGTAALIAGILAVAGRASSAKPLCLMPAYTFIASAAAAEQCGYRPCLVDVDPDSWALDPLSLASHPDLDRAGLVMVVAPYGRQIDQQAWQDFQERTGVPVIIDGAAMVERLMDAPDATIGKIPVAVSFHATKAFSTGEGGAVVTSDPDLLLRAAQALNFGFWQDRRASAPGFNGKMSEYHAAVGLAELDGWERKKRDYATAARTYRRGTNSPDLVLAPCLSSNYALLLTRCDRQAFATKEKLTETQIGWRCWYGGGLHTHSILSYALGDDLPVTESLANRVIGIPMSPDVRQAQIKVIMNALRAL